MELIRRAVNFEVRQVGPPEARTLEFIGSTAHTDRYGDIIEVAGWETKHFKANPVFLWAHNYDVPPVGTAKKIIKTVDALKFHIYFPTDEEINAQGWPSHIPTPETVYKLYQAGLLKATSVGFQDIEKEPLIDKKNEGRQTGWRFIKQELYELSAVPVPGNPYALLQDAVQKGIVSEREIEPFLESEDGNTPFPSGEECNKDIEKRLEALGLLSMDAEELLEFAEEQAEKIKELEAKAHPQNIQVTITGIDREQIIKQIIPELEKHYARMGKKITDYYSLALNPGIEPPGGRQAKDSEILEVINNSLKDANPLREGR